MASQWFYKRDGKKYGPVSSVALREMAANGSLHRTDLIWKHGMTVWRKAGDSQKLFQNAPTQWEQQNEQEVPPPEVESKPIFDSLKTVVARVAQGATDAAEKVKLETVVLPRAYLKLGEHCLAQKALQEEFPAEFREIEELKAKRKTTDPLPAAQPSLKSNAQLVVAKGVAQVSEQKARLSEATVLCRLGRLAFAKYGRSAGPELITNEIAAAIERITQITGPLTKQNQTTPKWKLAPKPLLISSLLLVGITVLIFSTGRVAPPNTGARELGGNGLESERSLDGRDADHSLIKNIGNPTLGNLTEAFSGQMELNKDAAPEESEQAARSKLGQLREDKLPVSEPVPEYYESDIEARNARYAPTPLPVLAQPEKEFKTAFPIFPDTMKWDTRTNAIVLSHDRQRNDGIQVYSPDTGVLIFTGLSWFPVGEEKPEYRCIQYGPESVDWIIRDSQRAHDCSLWDLVVNREPRPTTVLGNGCIVAESNYGAYFFSNSGSGEWPLTFFSPRQKTPLDVEVSQNLKKHVLPLLERFKEIWNEKKMDRYASFPPLLSQGKALVVRRWMPLPKTYTLLAELAGCTPGQPYDPEAQTNRSTWVLCDIKDSKVVVSQEGIPSQLLVDYAEQKAESTLDLVASSDSKKVALSTRFDTKAWERNLYIWDFDEPARCVRLKGYENGPVAFSPSGHRLLMDGNGIIRTRDGAVVCERGHGQDVQPGSGWALGGDYVVTRSNSMDEACFRRHEDDVVIRDPHTMVPLIRLRNANAATERNGLELKYDKLIAISGDGTKLAVLVVGRGFNDNLSEERQLLRVWDLRKVVKSIRPHGDGLPSGDGSFGAPVVVSLEEINTELGKGAQGAKNRWVGKWVAITPYGGADIERPSSGEKNYRVLLTDPQTGRVSVWVDIPKSRADHLKRLGSFLVPPLIAKCEAVVDDANNGSRIIFTDGDVAPSVVGGYEGTYYPTHEAEPITLDDFKKAKKGMSLREVRVLFGGTGEEHWEEMQSRARSLDGVALTYNEYMQRITVHYKGNAGGSKATLVFEGNHPDRYLLIQSSQVGLQ